MGAIALQRSGFRLSSAPHPQPAIISIEYEAASSLLPHLSYAGRLATCRARSFP